MKKVTSPYKAKGFIGAIVIDERYDALNQNFHYDKTKKCSEKSNDHRTNFSL